jgi:lipopolysaccharide transport system ATP-binding protein
VSHNLQAVRTLCQRVVWLKNGSVKRDGPADEVIEDYFNSFSDETSFSSHNEQYGFAVKRVSLKNGAGRDSTQFAPGEDMTVEVEFAAEQPLETPYIILAIYGVNGSCFTANMMLDGNRPRVVYGEGKLACRFKALPILPQNYSVKMSIRTKDANERILDYTDVAFFSVVGDLADYGFTGEFVSRASSATAVIVPYEWHLPDGSVAPVSLTGSSLSRRVNEAETVGSH